MKQRIYRIVVTLFDIAQLDRVLARVLDRMALSALLYHELVKDVGVAHCLKTIARVF